MMGSLEDLLGTSPPVKKSKAEPDNLANALGLGTPVKKTPPRPINRDIKPEIIPEPTATNLIDASEFHVKNQPENFKAEQVRILKENLDLLQNSFDDKELIGKALYTIVELVRQHPFLKDNITEDNMADMVKTLRSTYATVVMAKKTKTARTTKKSAKQNVVNELLSDMDIGNVGDIQI